MRVTTSLEQIQIYTGDILDNILEYEDWWPSHWSRSKVILEIYWRTFLVYKDWWPPHGSRLEVVDILDISFLDTDISDHLTGPDSSLEIYWSRSKVGDILDELLGYEDWWLSQSRSEDGDILEYSWKWREDTGCSIYPWICFLDTSIGDRHWSISKVRDILEDMLPWICTLETISLEHIEGGHATGHTIDGITGISSTGRACDLYL